MATFLERAANSLTICSLFTLCLFVILVVSHLGFEGWTLVLIALVRVLCSPSILLTIQSFCC